MTTRENPSRPAFIAAFSAIYLIWGSTYLGIRVAVSSMPPFLMAGVRFLLAGGVLFAFLRFRGAPWPTMRQWRDNTVVGTCLLLGGNGLLAFAEQSIPSGISALMIGICPVFMVLTEWSWPGGQRPSKTTLAGLLLGFCGVAWLAAPWENSARGGLPFSGLFALLGSCLCWSIGSIYSRHAREPATPALGSALQMLTGGVALALTALSRGELTSVRLASITTASWWAFAYLITIGSLVGYSTFVWLMKHSTPARVSTYAYVNPIVAVFLGWWLLGEPISTRTILAAAIIVLAVVIITVQKTKKTEMGGASPHAIYPVARTAVRRA